MTTGTKLGLSLAVALAIIAALGIGSYLSTEQLLETNRLVLHTHQTIDKLGSISSAVKDAEIDCNNYLQTGREEFLAAHAAAFDAVRREIHALHELEKGDPVQAKSVDTIQTLAERLFAELQATLDLGRLSGTEAARRAIRSEGEKGTLEGVQSAITEMEDRERRLLEAQYNASRASAGRTIAFVAVGTPLSLLVLTVFAMVITGRGGSRRLGIRPGTGPARWRGIALRYCFAVMAVAVGTAARIWLAGSFGPLPTFITLYPAVLLVASVAGGGPGILASILAALAAAYFYLPPGGFGVDAPNDVLALTLFMGTSLLLSVLLGQLRKSQWAEAVSATQEEELDLLDMGTILALDPDHRIVRWSEGCRRLYGYEAEEALGRVTHDLFQVSPDDSLDEARRALLEQGHWQGERVRRAKDGSQRTIAVLWALRRDAKGQPHSIMELSADITDRKRAEDALRESQARYATTLASIGDAVIATDTESAVTFLNPVAEELTGWTLREAMGKPLAEVFRIINEFTREEVESPAVKVLQKGLVVGLANHTILVRKDGTEKPIDDSGAPIRDLHGNITGVVLVFRDISERKEAERELRESERRNEFLAEILRNASQPFAVGYPDGRLGLANPAFERLTGYDADELRGIDWATALTPPEWAEIERRRLAELHSTGQPIRYEKEYLRKDGLRVPVELLVHLVKNADGAPDYYYSFLTDITERKRSEEALRRARDELEHRVVQRTAELTRANRELARKMDENARTLEALRKSEQSLAEAQHIGRMGNWDWNFDTNELFWSNELYRLFGLPPQTQALEYAHVLEQVHPDDRAYLDERVNRALRGEEKYSAQYRIVLADGGERTLRAQGEVELDGKNEPVRFYGTVMDVTEQVRAEEEARVRQQQLVQADKLVSLGILTAGVAHEINNPNHSIKSNVTVLAAVWEDVRPILDRFHEEFGDFVMGGFEYSECRDKMPGMFAHALASSKRIELIVNELRGYARNSPGECMAAMDVNAVVNSAVILLSSMTKKHTDRFSVELGEGVPPVIGNHQRIEQVVINLIQNACQSLPGRDRAVMVSTRHDKVADLVVIEVVDEGVGIAEDKIKLLGTPFYTTKLGSDGMGLGLWISSSIAHEHGGALNFSSKEDEGTHAVLSLPAGGRPSP